MFYKIIINDIPVLYNLSIIKRVALNKNSLYMYYKYTSIGGNSLIFMTSLKEEFTKIDFETEECAKEQFENIEKFLK